MRHIVLVATGLEVNETSRQRAFWFRNKVLSTVPNAGSYGQSPITKIQVLLIDTANIVTGVLAEYLVNDLKIPLTEETVVIGLSPLTHADMLTVQEAPTGVRTFELGILDVQEPTDVIQQQCVQMLKTLKELAESSAQTTQAPAETDAKPAAPPKYPAPSHVPVEGPVKEEIDGAFLSAMKALSTQVQALKAEQQAFLSGAYKGMAFTIHNDTHPEWSIHVYPDETPLPHQHDLEMHFSDALNLALMMHHLQGVITSVTKEEVFARQTVDIEEVKFAKPIDEDFEFKR